MTIQDNLSNAFRKNKLGLRIRDFNKDFQVIGLTASAEEEAMVMVVHFQGRSVRVKPDQEADLFTDLSNLIYPVSERPVVNPQGIRDVISSYRE